MDICVMDMDCLICSIEIKEANQYYKSSNIGPEITSIIEKNLGHEIGDSNVICANCFESVKHDFSNMSSGNTSHDPLALPPPDTNVCINCRTSLFNKRCQMVGEGLLHQYISVKIAPRTIPEGSRVCYTCWVYIQSSLHSKGVDINVPENTNNCVWCQVSLGRRRRHALPEGPERDEILQQIHPREIPPGGLVCYACWVKAGRNVKRAIKQSQNNNIEQPGPSNSHHKDACVWCGISLFRKPTHILTRKEKETVATKIYPKEMPEHALACSNCSARTQEIIQFEQGNVIELTVPPSNPAITLDNFFHTTSSSRHCFVPGCKNSERLSVPKYFRKRILKTQKVFVMENARVCAEHKCVLNWEFLDNKHFSSTFNKCEIESMLRLSMEED